ncbi:Premnaspirodiene oxygenase [Platanthera guangdongensis]|uniref:Premnaspirodiene oxygenase n=1 Tax=Platanthera guangdongensis TaxID=2320717 RepID=A0ABR2LDP9_9ASPA
MELPLLFFQSLLLCFLFLLFKSVTHNPTKNSKLRLPPGPWKLPIIGSIHHLAGDLPHRRLHRLSLTHGPLLHLKLGEIHHVVASTAATAHEILKTHDLALASRPAIAAIKTIAYDCAGMGFSPYGPYWRQLRKICAVELLSSKRVKSFAPIRRDEAAKAVGEIRRRGVRSSPVNMTELFLGLTNNHLTRAAFGKECRSRERFLRAMKETIKLAPVLSLVDLFPSAAAVISLFDGKMKRMRKLHGEMDAILNEIIEEHRESRGGDQESGELEEKEEDLVDVLMRVQESGELEIPLKMLHIKAVILDMLVAATETTSSTLVWVMTELIRHPEIMNKVQLEIREAHRGRKTIEESDLDDFHYLKRVIKETLRLHPPLPLLLPRTCSETVKLSGFAVPGGSRVMVNAWAIGRDPEIWEDPNSFFPDRFEESSTDFMGGNFSYIPFGGGRRICPGMTFAMSGLELFLAELLLRFDWKLPLGMGPEELDLEEEFDGSLRRKNDLCLISIPWDCMFEESFVHLDSAPVATVQCTV